MPNKAHHILLDGVFYLSINLMHAWVWSTPFPWILFIVFKLKLTSTLLSIPTKNVISATMSTNTRLRWILLRLQWRLYRHNIDRNARIKAIRDKLSPRYVITSNTTLSDTRLCKKKGKKTSIFIYVSKIMDNIKVAWWRLSNTFIVIFTTQQNSYSISHLLGTVTTLWLDSDGVVTVDNCQQHGDYSWSTVVTVLPTVNNGDQTITIQSLCSHFVL